MSKITVTTIAGQTSGSDANKVKIESGDTLEVTSNATVGGTFSVTGVTGLDGNVNIGNNQDINMDNSASGQIHIDGVGYNGAIALNASGMNIYTNSASRPLIFGVNETEVCRITTGGLAIGGTGAANTLDDYEEGTWTPAFQSTSASFSYSVQGGNYTKVGRLVFANFRIQLSGAPSGTTSNVVFVSGLPFVIGSLNGTYHGGHPGHYYNFNLNTGASKHGTLAYQLPQGESKVELKVVGDNLGETAVLASHLNSTAQIRGQILYHTT